MANARFFRDYGGLRNLFRTLFLECTRSVKVRNSFSSFSFSVVLVRGASSSPAPLNASYMYEAAAAKKREFKHEN